MEAFLPLVAEAWVPKTIIEMANRLGTEFQAENNCKGLSVLSRLVSDPRMRSIWQVLYSKARDPNNYEHTGEFFHAASFLPASRAKKMREEASTLRKQGAHQSLIYAQLLEAEARSWEALPAFNDGMAWSEQDRAVQHLFAEACVSEDIEPAFLSELQANADKFEKIASNLREQAGILGSLGWLEQAQTLADIASHCDDQSFGAVVVRTDAPAVLARNRSDTEMRTYIVRLSILTNELFAKPLYGVLASLANVVFETDVMTSEKARDIVRNSSGL